MHFKLLSSEFVRGESERGDPEAAARRLAYLEGISELDITPEVERLAAEILAALNLPAKAAMDASHLAVAIHHKVDYLLT